MRLKIVIRAVPEGGLPIMGLYVIYATRRLEVIRPSILPDRSGLTGSHRKGSTPARRHPHGQHRPADRTPPGPIPHRRRVDAGPIEDTISLSRQDAPGCGSAAHCASAVETASING